MAASNLQTALLLFTTLLYYSPVDCRSLSTGQHSKRQLLVPDIIAKLAPHGQCSREAGELMEGRKRTTTIPVTKLSGQWLSSKCERLADGTFITRSYTFYDNEQSDLDKQEKLDANFKMTVFRYSTPTCSHPLNTLVATGYVHSAQPSWTVPGAYDATVTLHRVTTTPQTDMAARILTDSLRESCHFEKGKAFPWPDLLVGRPVLVFQRHRDREARLAAGLADGVTDTVDCIHSVNFTADELTLLRMDQTLKHGAIVRSLYTALLTTDHSVGLVRRPSHFQPPLHSVGEMERCDETCAALRDGDEVRPAKLRPVKVEDVLVPADVLDGDWMSEECEAHLNGMYVHRQLSYLSSAGLWSLRQRVYYDPQCTKPMYTLVVHGFYEPRRMAHDLPNAQVLIYIARRISITPESKSILENLQYQSSRCGADPKEWQLNQPNEINPKQTNLKKSDTFCRPFGLTTPERALDLIAVESGRSQDRLRLYTGDLSTGSPERHGLPVSLRSSALVKCTNDVTVVLSIDQSDGGASAVDDTMRYMFWRSAAGTAAMLPSVWLAGLVALWLNCRLL